jgi:hypothetical protein
LPSRRDDVVVCIKEDLMSRELRSVVGLLMLVACVGCSGQAPPASIDASEAAAGSTSGSFNRDYPYVIDQEADYYATGPQQGAPPDGKFAAGTQVKVRRQTGGYWLVESTDRVSGYVDSQSVRDPTVKNALP